jgi:hypothetical protein
LCHGIADANGDGRIGWQEGEGGLEQPIMEGLTRRATVIDSPKPLQMGRPNAAIEDLNEPRR